MPTAQTHPHQSIEVHAQSTTQALQDEHEYAAHNYHPLPVVFAKAEGARVWDPEVRIISFIFLFFYFLPLSRCSIILIWFSAAPASADPAVRAWPREARIGVVWWVDI